MSTSHRLRIFPPLCVLAAVLLLCACEKEQADAPPPPKVSYIVLKEEQLDLVTELPGRVSAYMVSEVRPQISGIVQKRLFEEGGYVRAGQPLYLIDPALFRAEADNAEANLARAKAREVSAKLLAERYQKLIAVNAVSRQELDDAVSAGLQAEADVRTAEEALTTAKINLGYTEVVAPVRGRVGRSYVTPGALVTKNQDDPLAVIQHLDLVYVDMTQANVEVLRLARALQDRDIESDGTASATVRLRLEDGTPYAHFPLPEKNSGEPDWIEGVLLFSEVSIDKSTGVVTLRAAFPNSDHTLLPGMHVRAALVEGAVKSALLVPQRAVLRDKRGEAFVYVLHEGRQGSSGGEAEFSVEMRPVEIARSVGNRWLVASGLAAGERLVFEGHIKARPGMIVRGMAAERNEVFSAALGATRQER